jgi:hypothetical protein
MALTLKKPPASDEEAAKRSKPPLLPDGVYLAFILAALDALSKKNRAMIVLTILVRDEAGNEREIPIYLTTADAGLTMLRHCCIAVGALDAFNQGAIESSLFPGHDVRVLIGTEKKAKWPARNVVLDVLPPETTSVVPLHAAE